KTFHPPLPLNVSYTATPVFGSATAETSAMLRCLQPESFCQAGFGSLLVQPEPEPSHAVSVQPRLAVGLRLNVVPPTAVTNGSAAGEPKLTSPESPLDAVITTPGWL